MQQMPNFETKGLELSTLVPKFGHGFRYHCRHSGGSRNPGFSVPRSAQDSWTPAPALDADPGFAGVTITPVA